MPGTCLSRSPSERRTIQAAFRQLRGLAVNVNQIAYALKPRVLTRAGAELTREEVAPFASSDPASAQ